MNIKHLLRYPFDIRIAQQQLEDRRDTALRPSEATIGLDLYTDQLLFDCGRHLSCFAAFASRIGSPLVLRCGRVMLAAIAHKPHGRRFLGMPHVRWIDCNDRFPSNSLILLDVDGGRGERVLSGQRTVSMLIGRDVLPRTHCMPYPMHPSQIEQASPEVVRSMRDRPKAGVFFAGSQKRRYGRMSMNAEFKILSRLEVLETLRRNFQDRVEDVTADGDASRIVLRDSETHPIDKDEWMDTLASHQFFVCCPGASQPICHNLIESMSVGSIPIIEFSDRLQPELVDGHNAICFRGRKGLVSAIRRIDSMSAEKVRRISKNAAEYYDQHLDGEKFFRRLRDELNTDFVDQVSMPFHSENFYSKANPPSGRVSSSRRRAA